MGAKINMKLKNVGKMECRKRTKKCYFSKSAKNEKNCSKVRFWAETGQKTIARVVGFRGPGSQGAAPTYAHATKEEKGPAERKKKQERKKGQVERGDKRDLNTLEARGPANFWYFVQRLFWNGFEISASRTCFETCLGPVCKFIDSLAQAVLKRFFNEN